MGPYRRPGPVAGGLHPMAIAITERIVVRRGSADTGGGVISMFGPSAASRRFLRLRRILIGLQVVLLLFSMAAPVGTIAAEPSSAPTESSTPSSDPTPSTDPMPDLTPDATAASEPTTAPDPTVVPDPSTAPAPDPTTP